MTPPSNPNAISPELMIKLIKEDLKINKLLLGLNQLGIVAEPYYSDLGSIVLVLMGYQESDDDRYAFYQQQLEMLTSIENFAFHLQLDNVARQFYDQLRIKGD